MSNKPCVAFQAQFKGDGSSTTLSLSTIADPIVLVTGGNVISPLFGTGTTATGVSGLSLVESSPSISGFEYSTLTRTLTVTFDAAPAADTIYTLQGTLEF